MCILLPLNTSKCLSFQHAALKNPTGRTFGIYPTANQSHIKKKLNFPASQESPLDQKFPPFASIPLLIYFLWWNQSTEIGLAKLFPRQHLLMTQAQVYNISLDQGVRRFKLKTLEPKLKIKSKAATRKKMSMSSVIWRCLMWKPPWKMHWLSILGLVCVVSVPPHPPSIFHS